MAISTGNVIEPYNFTRSVNPMRDSVFVAPGKSIEVNVHNNEGFLLIKKHLGIRS